MDFQALDGEPYQVFEAATAIAAAHREHPHVIREIAIHHIRDALRKVDVRKLT